MVLNMHDIILRRIDVNKLVIKVYRSILTIHLDKSKR